MLAITLFASISAAGQDLTSKFDANKMRERVKTLSDDKFEGRGPGTAGGKLAADYIADEMKSGGIKPVNKGSYFQNVKMVGIKADPNTKLVINGKAGQTELKFGDEFVATTSAQISNVDIDAELVFAGYGIDAPNNNWNDYSGPAEDYRGKVLMILVNDPPPTTAEPDRFGGKGLTYYGRWTYKYEEAALRGAAGVILVHTDNSAGYGWNVVRTSNGSWRYEIARTSGDVTPYLRIKSWATESASATILRSAGLDLKELQEKAAVRGFKPIDTGLRVKIELNSEITHFESPNVVGMIEGSDKKLRREYVIYTAHWDHLGIGEPNAEGDKIYNGAYDNASGIAAVLGIADVLAKTPVKERPKRSFMFLFPTAEEQGLLGTEYYAAHPIIPLAKTAANVNIDGVNFAGKVKDFMALGAERSSIKSIVDEVAAERKFTAKADLSPEQGFFFRSDHFPFAKVGVPAISLQHGEEFIDPPSKEAAEFMKSYGEKHYHQASDEYHDWWDMSAMIQEAEIGLAIGIKLADLKNIPHYNTDDEFSVADKKRGNK